MGSGFDVEIEPYQVGIIPRAINQLFDGIKAITEEALLQGRPPPRFTIYAQFLELYNEDVIDLFDTTKDYTLAKTKSGIKIHEDAKHSIYLSGVTSKAIHSAEEALQCLRQGALSRTTASTQMNAQSSRSHAIFTLHIEQKKIVKLEVRFVKILPPVWSRFPKFVQFGIFSDFIQILKALVLFGN